MRRAPSRPNETSGMGGRVMYRPPLANGRVKLCLVSAGTLHPDSQILGSILVVPEATSLRPVFMLPLFFRRLPEAMKGPSNGPCRD